MSESEAVTVSIPVGNLADEVMKQLGEYAEVTTDGMKKAVNDAGKTVKKEIQANAPVQSGKYKKSWTVKKTAESATKLEITVHADGEYTVLLEGCKPIICYLDKNDGHCDRDFFSIDVFDPDADLYL